MSHPHRTWFRRLDHQCEAVRETISAELDGEVSEIEAALARRHRAECADCEQFALSVAHTTDVLRAAPPVQPSRRLMPAPARVVSRGLAVAGFAAAMFVAALLGAGLASHVTGTPAPAPRHDLIVAKGSGRDAMAREQMLIREMLPTCARWITSPATNASDRRPGLRRVTNFRSEMAVRLLESRSRAEKSAHPRRPRELHVSTPTAKTSARSSRSRASSSTPPSTAAARDLQRAGDQRPRRRRRRHRRWWRRCSSTWATTGCARSRWTRPTAWPAA